MGDVVKQLVILSGKGGSGKTSVVAALAHLAKYGEEPITTVMADVDVDAANLDLILSPKVMKEEDFWGGQIAIINQDVCISCGDCEQVCRFDAISHDDLTYDIDPIACDGCAACVYACPVDAIRMEEQIVGQWFQSESVYGPLFHASLKPAQENSGKLVTVVKQHARLEALDFDYSLVLIDGPPGIGCPVISAASGADLALIVAEPTVSGVSDMQRILKTTNHFGIRSLVCINKADIYPESTEQIINYCRENEIEYVGSIPFDSIMTEAMVNGKSIIEYAPESKASQAIEEIWRSLLQVIHEDIP
jgi:MinD superfamily P-loop ATPase